MGCISGIYDLVRIPIKKPCRGYYLRWYYNGWHYWFFLPGKYSVIAEGENYKTIGTRKIDMGSGQIDRNQAEAIRTITNTREVYLLTIYGWMNIRIDPGNLIMYDHRQEGLEIEITATIGSKEISYDTGLTPIPIIPVITPTPYVPACGLCVIGVQEWAACNYDILYPGSKVYDNDEANRAKYGGLYTYAQIMNPGFLPVDYHIPTLAEANALIAYLGGSAVAGGVLKESGLTYWNSPNVVGSPVSCFAARGAGIFNSFSSNFVDEKNITYIWTTWISGSQVATIRLDYDAATATISYIDQSHYASVRLIKNTIIPPYSGWGQLYNYPAMINAHGFAPAGWHLPTDAELIGLYTDVGGAGTAGTLLKEAGSTHWNVDNLGTDIYSFRMWGVGYRSFDGSFLPRLTSGYLGSLTPGPSSSVYFLLFLSNSASVSLNWYGLGQSYGWPLRFVKDDSFDPGNVLIDGKIYETVKIGSKVYTRSCVAIENYADGTPIPEITNDAAWQADATGARCWFNNVPE